MKWKKDHKIPNTKAKLTEAAIAKVTKGYGKDSGDYDPDDSSNNFDDSNIDYDEDEDESEEETNTKNEMKKCYQGVPIGHSMLPDEYNEESDDESCIQDLKNGKTHLINSQNNFNKINMALPAAKPLFI